MRVLRPNFVNNLFAAIGLINFHLIGEELLRPVVQPKASKASASALAAPIRELKEDKIETTIRAAAKIAQEQKADADATNLYIKSRVLLTQVPDRPQALLEALNIYADKRIMDSAPQLALVGLRSFNPELLSPRDQIQLLRRIAIETAKVELGILDSRKLGYFEGPRYKGKLEAFIKNIGPEIDSIKAQLATLPDSGDVGQFRRSLEAELNPRLEALAAKLASAGPKSVIPLFRPPG